MLIDIKHHFHNKTGSNLKIMHPGLSTKKHPADKFFSPIVVMHVYFITICFYLQVFIFVCCYAFFFLNNSYFFLLIFQLYFWFFLFSRAIDEEAFNRLIFSSFVVMHVCFYLQGSNFVCCYACFFLTNTYFSRLWHWSWLPNMVFNNGTMHALLFQ